jgi:hypothetical protein
MKKIETVNIAGSQDAPFVKQTFDHYNESIAEVTAAIVESTFNQDYNTGDVVILSGCIIDPVNIPGDSDVTAGKIYYNGEIFLVDADTVTTSGSEVLVWNIVETYAAGDPIEWSDGINRNLHLIRKFALQAGLSGSGLADYDETLAKRKTKLIEIGPWNMAATDPLGVAHGLTALEYATASVLCVTIINDADTKREFLGVKQTATGVDNGVRELNSTNVSLTRKTGGQFDDPAYNDAVMNRGYIEIMYGDI